MKKLIALLLALVMVLGLAACGTSDAPATEAPKAETPADTPADKPVEEPAAKTLKVGIALALTDDFTENLRALEEAAAAERGIDVTFTNAGGDASMQIANVEALIAQQPDVIVLRCIDAETGDTLVEMVHAAGIPCIVDETMPTNNRDYDANIAGNQSIHGNLIGTYLQTYLDANPDVTLNMLYINGGTSDNIRKRMNGIFETCTSDRLIQIGDELGSWSAATAQEITEAYLTSHPEMNLICCANDEMALGVIETLKGAGKLDEIMVFGVDGSVSGQESVKAGELHGTTFNDVSIAVGIIFDCCEKVAAGEDLSALYSDATNKTIDPKAYILLTAENIATDGTIG